MPKNEEKIIVKYVKSWERIVIEILIQYTWRKYKE